MRQFRRRTFVWQLEATQEDSEALLSDVLAFPTWWPSSWHHATEIAVGRTDGVGKIVSVRTRGATPWGVAWAARMTEYKPSQWAFELYGDLEGSMRIAVDPSEHQPQHTTVTWTWEIALKHPRKYAMPMADLLFFGDLHWMMNRGQISAQQELARRQGSTTAGSPPPPTTTSTLPWTLAAAGIVAAAVGVLGIVRRRAP
jgi:hypothetical protein